MGYWNESVRIFSIVDIHIDYFRPHSESFPVVVVEGMRVVFQNFPMCEL